MLSKATLGALALNVHSSPSITYFTGHQQLNASLTERVRARAGRCKECQRVPANASECPRMPANASECQRVPLGDHGERSAQWDS